MTKSEQDGNHASSHYLVVEDPEHPSTWHLRVRDASGAVNHTLMGAAWAALHGGYRGNKYEGPNKAEAISKLKGLYKSEGMPLPSESASDDGRVAVLLAGLGKAIEVAGKATHEIPICLIGTWVKNSHKFSITAEDLADIVRNFEKRKNSQVVIDYEHASEQPDVSRGGPIPAAGWIHGLRFVGSNDESYVTLNALVEWTPEAQRLIQSGQYRFFSPAIDWNFPDKETGHSQGATLTSGALTNHPFLEELPPITLTESGFLLADVSTGYLDAPVTSPRSAKTADRGYQKLNGGKMASKKLTICKVDGSSKKFDGEDFKGAQGHHGIFDGDDFVGHVRADDMKDHVKSCMGDGFGDLDDLAGTSDDDGKAKGQAGVKGHQTPDGKMSELLRESGVRSQESGETPEKQVLAALKLAATHQLVEQREASRNLLLAECVAAGVAAGFSPAVAAGFSPASAGLKAASTFDTQRAKELLRDSKISAADLLDAIEAKGMIDEAVSKGKVLPKDRAFFFEIAFNNPKKFTDYIAGAVPVVSFSSVGLGSTEQMPVDQEVDVETKKLMSERKVGYGKAMKEVFRANPQLEERYRAAHRVQPRTDAPVSGSGITQ